MVRFPMMSPSPGMNLVRALAFMNGCASNRKFMKILGEIPNFMSSLSQAIITLYSALSNAMVGGGGQTLHHSIPSPQLDLGKHFFYFFMSSWYQLPIIIINCPC
jgi:hypothetical protein